MTNESAASAAAEAIAKAAGAAPAPRKEAAGIVKRSSAFSADPTTITRKAGFNPRFDFGDIDGLAKSIKANGLMNPLRIKRVSGLPAGKLFELIDGDRRLTAIEKLIKAGEVFPEGVPVVIVDKAQTDKDDLIQMFVANDGKKFLPLEEAEAYGRMRAAGMTIKQIGEAVGRAHVHVTEILGLLDADESLKDAVRSGKVGKQLAKTIGRLAKGDKAKQAELAKKAVEAGKDKAKLRSVKKDLDESHRAKAKAKGRALKIRALDDAQLSELGAKIAGHLVKILAEAGKPADFDIRAWVKEDDKLALAATFGALEALKRAAGQDIDLGF